MGYRMVTGRGISKVDPERDKSYGWPYLQGDDSQGVVPGSVALVSHRNKLEILRPHLESEPL